MMLLAMSDANFQSLMQMVGLAILAYLTYRTEVAKITLASLRKDVEVVHKATNSIVQQLVDQAVIKGRAEGRADERERTDSTPAKTPSGTEDHPMTVQLATTDVKTGEQLADKDDMIAAVTKAAEAVKEAAKEVIEDAPQKRKPKF